VIEIAPDQIQRMIDALSEALPRHYRLTVTVRHASGDETTHETYAEAEAEVAYVEREDAEIAAAEAALQGVAA